MDFIRMAAVGLNGLIRNRIPLLAAIGDVCPAGAEVEADFETDLEADFGADFDGVFGADAGADDDVGSAKSEREVEATCAYKKNKFIRNESK